MNKVAGVVLAGGRSSRMGTNKALLRYRDVPLIEHMQNLLMQAGIVDIYISGDVPGYDCVHDEVCYAGPAGAMNNLLKQFYGLYNRILFVPVDMPLIQVKDLCELLEQDDSVYYEDYPLPACLLTGDAEGNPESVRKLLENRAARSVSFLSASGLGMLNINTPQEWEGIQS